MTEQIFLTTEPAPVADENGWGADVTPADETEDDHTIADLCHRVSALTDAVRLIGEQQQYTTDTISHIHQQFSGMMAGGNPLKMLSQLMGGGKGKAVNG